jgi:pimeloyl-ACP methyl ester carboxylesterase
MKSSIISGRKICYDSNPDDLDKTRLTIVFIHGSGGDSQDWRFQLDDLGSLVNALAFELPGHGWSEGPGESTVAGYANWVRRFVETLDLQKVMIVGCSLGSAITQLLALESLPRISAIGLVGAGARLKVHPMILDLLLKDGANALTSLTGYSLSNNPNPNVVGELKQKFGKLSPILVHNDLSACNNFDLMKEVKNITIPTWIAVGDEDKLTPVKYARYLNEAITGSSIDIIPLAGHLVMLEQPVPFNIALRKFIIEKGLI